MLDVQIVTLGWNHVPVAVRFRFGEIDVVADFPLESHVRHQALHRLRVETRRVGCIGVAVRVAISAVKQVNEVVAVFDNVVHDRF